MTVNKILVYLFLSKSLLSIAQKNYSVADIRLKKNIVGLHGALGTVLKMRGVSYDWKTKSYPQFQHKVGQEIGFVAQEVEECEPLLVDVTPDGFKSVEYERVTALLVEAIKEQQQLINHLKKQMNMQHLEIEQLKSQLNKK